MPETLILPVRPVDIKWPISCGFGTRTLDKGEEFHRGIDFAVPVGTPVVAMVDGVIFRAGWEKDETWSPDYKSIGFGLRVWQTFILGERKFYAWYGHLSELKVEEGQAVRAGDLVGLSGATGRTFSSSHAGPAPHLHAQVRERDTNDFFNLDWKTKEAV